MAQNEKKFQASAPKQKLRRVAQTQKGSSTQGTRVEEALSIECLELIHKTCRVYDGKLKEHISFPHMKYDKLVQREWEESDFNQIIEAKFMFVFWENVKDEFYLRNIVFWNAPPKEVKEAKRIWERTKLLIIDKQADNLPKVNESYFVHVRPHGRDSNDKYPTPYGVDVKKQSFWMHKKYIEENILNN